MSWHIILLCQEDFENTNHFLCEIFPEPLDNKDPEARV